MGQVSAPTRAGGGGATGWGGEMRMGSTGGGAVAVARGTRECEVRAAPIQHG